MPQYKQQLNQFLVDVFGDILRLEQIALREGEYKNLSVNEMHVIETVLAAQPGGQNTMAQLAKELAVSAGTLTTSVQTLERKGYLSRTRKEKDKRQVWVAASEEGKKAALWHRIFHENMVKGITSALTEAELSSLTLALGSLHRFFMQQHPNSKTEEAK